MKPRTLSVLLLLTLGACSPDDPRPTDTKRPTPPAKPVVETPSPRPEPESDPLLRKSEAPVPFTPNAFVEKVVDGDTARLRGGETVRFIGIDTPEKEQPYYEEAKRFNASLVEGKDVQLEMDVEQRDKYGRLLAYLYVLDSAGKKLFVNGEIVRNGFAYIYTLPPNVKHAETFLALQKEARGATRGFWTERVVAEKYYVASAKSTVFHRPGCESASKIGATNRRKFETRDAALDSGRSPCRGCKP